MPLPLEEAANLLERRSSDIQDLVKCTALRKTLKVSRCTLFLCPTSKATGVPGYLPPGAKPVAAYPTYRKNRMLTCRYVLTAIVSVFVLGLAMSVGAAPKAELWPRWQQYNAQNPAQIDFTFWNSFLAKYVDAQHPSGIHRLRYASVSAEDRQALEHFIVVLQTYPISTYNQQEQQVYWINLYNALTVSVILAHYPVASIRDIRLSGLFSTGPWQAKLVTIEGEKVSLDDIEHRILRPIWQ